MMNKQFDDVPCKYGAPMGRRTFGSPDSEPETISVFRVVMVDDDYDDGGAYWGGGGPPLWCAKGSEGYRDFTRANTYEDAVENLGLNPAKSSHVQELTKTWVDEFLKGYLQAALWSETDDNGNPLDETVSVADFADTQESSQACGTFIEAAWPVPDYWSPQEAGFDFWLTRNGHGVSFLDTNHPEARRLYEIAREFRGTVTYIGDDGRVYTA